MTSPQDQEIIQELQLPIKSFRLFAIEKAMAGATSPALLEALQKQLAVEDDPECRLMLEHAVGRLTPPPSVAAAPIAASGAGPVGERWESATGSEKLTFLDALSARDTGKWAAKAQGWLTSEADSPLKAQIIRKFARHFSPDDLRHLADGLKSRSLAVRLAVLETLSQHQPAILVEHLPGLLTSNDPRVRSLAVKGLAAIDLHEALEYLDFMLFQGDRPERLAAIQNLLLLPFESVKSLLLRYFSAETDPDLLTRAGALFSTNADLEVPLLLWGILEQSGPEKARLIKEIIRESCQVIDGIGLGKSGDTLYSARLQEWIYRNTALKFARECVSRLETADAQGTLEIAARIRQNLEKPHLREAFGKSLEWANSPPVRSLIREILSEGEETTPAAVAAATPQAVPTAIPAPALEPTYSGPSPAVISASTAGPGPRPPLAPIPVPPPAPPAAPTAPSDTGTKDFARLSDEETLRAMATWKPTDDGSEAALLKLRKILAAPSISDALRAGALRAALRLEKKEFVREASAALKKSDPVLLAAALEYLGTFDPEALFPLLGKYLKHANHRVKSTAIRLLQKYDPRQAVSSLVAMLNEPGDEKKALALACFVHFDFALVRKPLCDFLKTCTSSSLFELGLCLFQANFEAENLYFLFDLGKAVSRPGQTDLVKKTAAGLEQNLVEMGLLDTAASTARLQEFEKRWSDEQARLKAPPPAYALSRNRAVLEHQLGERLLEFAGEHREGVKWLLLALVLIGSVILWYVAPTGEAARVVSKSGPMLSDPVDFQGVITDKLTAGGPILVKTASGEILQILPVSREFGAFEVGARVRGVVIPFQRTREGRILCRYQSIAKR